MGKLEIPALIRLEDYKTEEQQFIRKLAKSINPFMEGVYRLLNGTLNASNMLRQINTVDIKIDTTGKVINSPQVRIDLKSKVVGISVITAINLIDANVYPTNSPFISYTTSSGIITIKNITGLQVSSQYRLTLEIIGN